MKNKRKCHVCKKLVDRAWLSRHLTTHGILPAVKEEEYEENAFVEETRQPEVLIVRNGLELHAFIKDKTRWIPLTNAVILSVG